MDQNTTNINDLPIDKNPPEDRDLPESELNMNRNRMIEDTQTQIQPTKRVHFEENKIIKTQLYEIKESHKIIILASLFFLLFSDLKVKSYVMNIFIVILGNSLKTTSGGISKIGLVVYSLVYGISLFLLVNLIDSATAQFA
jgi:hypothetical protein